MTVVFRVTPVEGHHVVTLAKMDDVGGTAVPIAEAPLPEADIAAVRAAASAPDLLGLAAADGARFVVGRQLFALLNQGDVATAWESLMVSEPRPDRVHLEVRSPQLQDLPWELLRDRSGFLFRRPDLPWSLLQARCHETPPAPAPGPLRVLLVVCDPRARELLSDGEIARIGGGIAERRCRIHIEVLDGPTDIELRREIDSLRPHVLHFIGHGMARPGGSRMLAFNWTTTPHEGRKWGLRSEDVGDFSQWKPQLVVLNACRTAHDPVENIQGLAEAFLDAGAWAVVSMQADVESPAAAAFSWRFYEALGRELAVDRAVAAARADPELSRGGRADWALPRLTVACPPQALLRMWFVAESTSFERVCREGKFLQLAEFVGRYHERRTAWWALDPQPAEDAAAASNLLVVTGQSRTGLPETGKSWLTFWSLLTCYLRGHRITYVDLGAGSKDWFALVKAVRTAVTAAGHPDPLPEAAFAAFDAQLPKLTGDDKGQAFNDNRRHADLRKQQILTEFVAALRDASGSRTHVIALDRAHVLDQSFDAAYQCFVRPIAAGDAEPLRLVIVARTPWVAEHLPAEDVRLRKQIELGDIPAADIMRLARDYYERRNLPFENLEATYESLRQRGGPVTIRIFEMLASAVSMAELAREHR